MVKIIYRLFFVFMGLTIVNGAWCFEFCAYGQAKDGSMSIRKKTAYNVILISVPCLRFDHLSCYGYSRATTPNIDKFAKKSFLFTQAYSQSTWTLPSMASLFTSKDVIDHKVFNCETKLADFELTLAEVLNIFGYKTAAFTSGVHFNKRFNLHQGFDVYEDIPFSTSAVKTGKIGLKLTGKREIKDFFPSIVEWLECNRGEKFFLFVDINDVHQPFYSPEDGDENMFDPEYEGIVDSLYLDSLLKEKMRGDLIVRDDGEVIKLQKKDVDHIISHYDAGIYYTDKYFGKLMNELGNMQLLENTIVILTSPHGIDLFDHFTLFHYTHSYPYEELVHVPLIFFHPSIEASNMRIKERVQLIDIFPTILECCNITVPKAIKGVSLFSLIKDGENIDLLNRDIYFTSAIPSGSDFTWKSTYGVRALNWKLFMRFSKPHCSVYELYNLDEDPYELNNLIYEEKDVRTQLIIKLNEWIKNADE